MSVIRELPSTKIMVVTDLPKEARLFKANHSRIGFILATTGICDVCNEDTSVIAIDSSENEYWPGCICKKCAMKLFKEKENGKP